MDGVCTIQQAAVALHKDPETIRFLIKNGLVKYGCAYRRRGSKRMSYIVYANKFYEETGIKIKESEVSTFEN